MSFFFLLYFVSSTLVARNKDYNFTLLCASFLVFHNQKNNLQLYKIHLDNRSIEKTLFRPLS